VHMGPCETPATASCLYGKGSASGRYVRDRRSRRSALPCEMPQIIRVDIGRCRDRAEGGGRREAFSHLTDIHILATIPEFSNIFFRCSTLPNRRSSMLFDGNLFCFWKFAEITALVLLYRRVKIYFLAHPARPLGPVRSYLTNGKRG